MKRWLVIVGLLSACMTQWSATVVSPPPPASTFAPTPTQVIADTGWTSAGGGIETRELSITFGTRRDRLLIARVDPGKVSFRVFYDPERPRRVLEWLEHYGARLVINGGFFDGDNRALGLLVADGRPFGQTYAGLGGLFGVQAGRVQIRSLIRAPYQSDEVFDQMVQSYPTLLTGGGEINTQIRDDGRRALRSVVGLDRSGRVVFLVSPRQTFTLTELADWLAESDLDLDTALNLDGGASSGLVVKVPEGGSWGLNSLSAVPAVIVVQ